MAAILSAEHLSKSYTLKKLLTDVTIYIGEHDRIGVVGVNGTGKSTLLKLLAGMEEPDGGVVMQQKRTEGLLSAANAGLQRGANGGSAGALRRAEGRRRAG